MKDPNGQFSPCLIASKFSCDNFEANFGVDFAEDQYL